MKIAIVSANDTKRKELVDKVVVGWNGTIPTPALSISSELSDDDVKIPSSIDLSKWNETEQYLYKRLFLLQQQAETYKDEKNLIYNGCTIDILANALLLSELGEVSPEFVEKIIYWNKIVMKHLDLIYILPAHVEAEEGKELSDEELETNRIDNIIYNLFTEYTDNLEKSQIFPPQDCPGIAVLETDDHITEMRLVIDAKGNLTGEPDPTEVQRLYNSIRDPKLLANVKNIMEQKSIPLVGGGTTKFSL